MKVCKIEIEEIKAYGGKLVSYEMKVFLEEVGPTTKSSLKVSLETKTQRRV